jgi:hypothetical protein
MYVCMYGRRILTLGEVCFVHVTNKILRFVIAGGCVCPKLAS